MPVRPRFSLVAFLRNSIAGWMVLVCATWFASAICAAEPAANAKVAAAAAEKQGLELFAQHVRVVLAHNCLSCHGGDATESEFDLNTREALLKGGKRGRAIEPGSADNSLLVKLINHQAEPKMPEEANKLTPQEITHIAQWIDLGAPYDKPLVDAEADAGDWTKKQVAPETREYWAFRPLGNPEPPAVKQDAWVRTPIDRFVLAKLEAKGIAPNDIASKRQLLRRATFDLIGLPPTPAETAQFLADESPEAYANLVDRLLASPHYGERWGRHWLDVARFAESHGFEQDYDRKFAFHFRDFVIQALNQDMPYDQFVRWQLAGDELAPDNPLALMATGFLGAGVFPTQITANEVERTRYDALDDMAATTGSAMLGLTVGCARCHDHKFDPIPQADYYRMASIFTTTVRSEIDLDLNPAAYQQAKAAFDAEHAPLAAALAKFETDELPGRFDAWDKSRPAFTPPKWLFVDMESKSQGGATFRKLDDGSQLVEGAKVANDVYTLIVRTQVKGVTAVRLEALSDPSLVKSGPGRAANGNFALSNFTVTAAPLAGGDAKPVKLVSAKSTFDQAGLPVAAAIDDNPMSSWAVDPQFGKDHAAVFEFEQPVGFDSGTLLTFTLAFSNNTEHAIGRPRLSLTTAARPVTLDGDALPQSIIEPLAKPADQRTPEQRKALLAWYATRDTEWQKFNSTVQQSLAKAPKPNTQKVMVASEGFTPIRHHTQGADFFNDTHFLRRGNADNKLGVAQPGYLQVLMTAPPSAAPLEDVSQQWRATPPQGWRTSYRRTGLANWITDTAHGGGSQLARVIVNRLWQHHLGRGIVATPNDFGVQGVPPTHPELLDWLARDLIASGWRLKALHKRIMTSAVYMQSSAFDAAKSKVDSTGDLYWRWTPRRLEAEAIRDSMLAASGTLDRMQFGPGTLDEGHNRRSIYFTIKRSVLIPTLTLFDAPEPLVSIGNRPSTTIAPQALLFMNSPHVRRYVTNFAARLVPVAEEDPADAVRQAYQVALARDPSAQELSETTTFLAAQLKSYEAAGQANARQLALADFCQVLMGLNEFVYID